MTTKQNGLPHLNTPDINKLPKFILHYKIHSKHGNELKTELGPVCRRCKLLIICYKVFDVHVTMHRDKFLVIKPTICTKFSNLFLE